MNTHSETHRLWSLIELLKSERDEARVFADELTDKYLKAAESLQTENKAMREAIREAHEAITTLMQVKRGGMQAANALIDASLFGRETLKKLQPFLP